MRLFKFHRFRILLTILMIFIHIPPWTGRDLVLATETSSTTTTTSTPTSNSNSLQLADLNPFHRPFPLEEELQFQKGKDFLTSLGYIKEASYKQFMDTSSIVLMLMGSAALAIVYNQKHFIELSLRAEEIRWYHTFLSNLNIALTLPVVPISSYLMAEKFQSEKLRHFSMEYFATLYLTQAEVLLLSFIPFHERPKKERLNFFEKYFRGKSSFPSGHMVPASTLFWKVFQYYGPLAAAAPAALTIMTGFERVHSEKHHITDVVGTFFIAALVSEGVRLASAYPHNHPLYKWIFEHKFNLEFFKGKDAIGTTIEFVF